MTYRRLAVLVEGLPPESLTKTAIRDDMDPYEMARASGVERPGWGPHTYTDDLLCRLGEAIDYVAWAVIASNSEKTPPVPAPWRRPGVLSAREKAEHDYEISRPVYEQIEAERADLRRRQAEHRAALAAAKAAQQPQPNM